MAQVKRNEGAAQEPAATNSRTFRTFLLMAQLEAREIGARIAQARKEAGLTQEQLAAVASFSQRSLQDYESGATIPYRHMRELSTILKRPVEWFLHGPDLSDRPDVRERLDRLEQSLDEIHELLRRALPPDSGSAAPAARDDR